MKINWNDKTREVATSTYLPDDKESYRLDELAFAEGFLKGAFWQRTALYDDDEAIEAIAREIYGEDENWGYVNDYGYGELAARWEDLGEEIQGFFMDKARAVVNGLFGAGNV